VGGEVTTVHHIKERRPGDVYIGRGSKWGNPFTHLNRVAERPGITLVETREDAIERYAAWVQTQPQLLAALPELCGKRLVCYCHPLPCHGDVLAELADRVHGEGGCG
jgi:hypothetical protein